MPNRVTRAGFAGTPTRAGSDFKALCRKLADALHRIEATDNISGVLGQILALLLEQFQAELGFEGGRIYERQGDDFVLCCGFGSSRNAPVGLRVPPNYLPHQKTLAEGVLIMHATEPGIDAAFEQAAGVGSTFAAIAVGEGNSHVIAFSIRGQVREEQILYSLTAVRHVINLKLEQQKVSGILEESRLVQETMLPAAPPDFEGFDIHGRSRPAESVSGDLFDYLPVSGGLLGIAIVDATGHGLPAALLARDAVTGLRMGVSENIKVARVIERLNQVIHRAALSHKFVAMFYGELSRDGTLVYCNAGHNPPLLRCSGGFLELERGGLVLGPIPGARYESDQVTLEPGDLLVMYTDGVVDRENGRGEDFGTDRLRQVVEESADRSAGELVGAVFDAVDRFARGAPQLDDMSVVVVRKI
jgi:serine phosphatase RsbU (regulator of sigma subunit)